MRFRILDLETAIKPLGGLITGKSPKPAHNCVTIVGRRNEAKATVLAGTDEWGMSFTIPCSDSASDSTISMQFMRLRDVVRESQSDEITVTKNKSTVLLQTGTASYRMTLGSEASLLRYPEVAAYITVPAGSLARAISLSQPFTGDDGDWALHGVQFDAGSETDRLYVVSSNRVCMSRIVLPVATHRKTAVSHLDWPVNCVVNRGQLRALLSAVHNLAPEVPVFIGAGENTVEFRWDGGDAVFRLAEGRFPRWQPIFDKATARTVVASMSQPELARSVRLVGIIDREDVEIFVRSDRIELRAVNPAPAGSGAVECMASVSGTASGGNIRLGRFCIDEINKWLSLLGDGVVTISGEPYSSTSGPILLCSLSSVAQDVVVMPRVEDASK